MAASPHCHIQNRNPAVGGGVRNCPSWGGERLRRPEKSSGGNLRLVVTGFPEHVAAAPHGLDVVLAVRRVGELLAQLADEHVDDLELGLVHAAVEMIEEHLLGER